MYEIGWKNLKEARTTLLMTCILGCEQLQYVLRLRSGYVGLCGTTGKTKLMKLRLKLASDLQSTREKNSLRLKQKKTFYFHSVRKTVNHHTKLQKQKNFKPSHQAKKTEKV